MRNRMIRFLGGMLFCIMFLCASQIGFAAQKSAFTFGILLVGPYNDHGWSQAHFEAGRYIESKVFLGDRQMSGQRYHSFYHRGVTFLPTNRLDEGLVTGLKIVEHFELQAGFNQFLIPRQAARENAQKQIEKYQIKGYPDSPVDALSGGNQQRLLLSMLPENPILLLLENPTRGLDIESASWVWTQLHRLCQNQTSIVFSSSDLDEIAEVSDRILVFFNGRIVNQFTTAETSMDELGRAVSGLQ